MGSKGRRCPQMMLWALVGVTGGELGMYLPGVCAFGPKLHAVHWGHFVLSHPHSHYLQAVCFL